MLFSKNLINSKNKSGYKKTVNVDCAFQKAASGLASPYKQMSSLQR